MAFAIGFATFCVLSGVLVVLVVRFARRLGRDDRRRPPR